MRLFGSLACFEVLGDYLFELETGARERGRQIQFRTLAGRAKKEAEPLSQFGAAAIREADRWERASVKEWAAQGRIAEGGRLRVGAHALTPYTLADVTRMWPHLRDPLDQLAVLIDLDGVVEGDFMEAHEHIRKVVQKISEQEVERFLATPQAQDKIADIAAQQVTAIFGSLADKLKVPAKTLASRRGRQLKCGTCRQPGHRATTCPKKGTPPGLPG